MFYLKIVIIGFVFFEKNLNNVKLLIYDGWGIMDDLLFRVYL